MPSRPGLVVVLVAALLGIPARTASGGDVVRAVRILAPNHVRVELAQPPAAPLPDAFRFTEANAPDVPIAITEAVPEANGRWLLTLAAPVSAAGHYRLELTNPAGAMDVHPAPWAWLLTIILSSALINNFVFTRYLGLCVFFGVSRKRETSIGMGMTFTAVMVVSAALSWALYTFLMKPLHLRFLQVLVFIGVVAFLVQMLDTVLKKTHATLHRKFGIYLVLITTNCIILAVPLLNAAADSGPLDSLALAVGSGAGFALALFLMSCAREKVELARVPKSFEGLPIAFALAGLFALAFMGFSGLNFLR